MLNEEELCAACALRDIALEEPHGLSDIEDLTTAKRVVSQIAPRLTIDQLLERISHSPYTFELLRFLPHVYGSMKEQLRPVVDLLLEKGSRYFDSDALGEFADLYWQAVVNERIARKDYRRAYDDIKRAFRGMRADPEAIPGDALYYPPKNGVPEDMATSPQCTKQMLHRLHAAMREAELIEDVLVTAKQRWPYFSDAPGMLFAAGVGGREWTEQHDTTLCDMQIMAIARYLNSERNDSRKRRRAAMAERQS